MLNRSDKRKGITINHKACIKQMDLLYTKLEENEGDHNNCLLQIKTLKEIIEKQSIEISELKKERDEYKEKQDKMENILDTLGVDKFDDFIKYISFLYEYKDEFLDFLNIKKNKIVQESGVSNNDEKYVMSGDYLDTKIKEALSEQKTIFDNKLQEQELKYNSLYDNFINLKKGKNSIPTPSASTERKKEQINVNDNKIISLPSDLNSVVHYRNIKRNDNTKSYIFREKDKLFLGCCGHIYKESFLNKDNHITCNRCFVSYVTKKDEISSCNILVKNIKKEHIIDYEEDILKNITCNNCGYIDKKEIKNCIKCKKMDNALIYEFNLPDKNEPGYEAKLLIAKETFTKVLYTSNIYNKAIKSGVDPSNFKEIVNYIKENKMIEEQQVNIIRNKIYRCYSLESLYNDNKYNSIKEYIERLNFSVKAISKLDQKQWTEFRNNLIYKLDNELKRIKMDFIKLDKNEVYKYNCKNDCCSEMTNKNDIYCLGCIPFVKKCKDCDEAFWTAEINIEHCKNCISDNVEE